MEDKSISIIRPQEIRRLRNATDVSVSGKNF